MGQKKGVQGWQEGSQVKFFSFRKSRATGYAQGFKIFSLVMVFLFVLFLLNACNLPLSPEIMRVWIDVPLDGLQTGAGQVVQIEGHASSHSRIEKIDLLVNGTFERQIEEPEMQGSLAYFRFQWTPSQAGDYALQIIAYGPDGQSSQLDTVVVHVAAQVKEEVEHPRITLTPQLFSPTESVQVVINTPLPSVTPTLIPSSLSENTQIPGPTNSPEPTHTQQPAITQSSLDSQGPPAPEIKSPSNGLDFPCISSLTLQWNTVFDPSGITEYRVEVEISQTADQWYSLENSPFTGLSTTVLSLQVECGFTYRWRVQAVDGYRNSGDYSNWSAFAVSQE